MAQSITGVITNLHAACRDTIYATVKGSDNNPVLVSLGEPGQFQPASLVVVGMDVDLPISRPTAGTGRSREMDAVVEVILSSYVPGDESAQATANAAAYDLLSRLETFFRSSPNETLSGACWNSYVSGAHLTATVHYQQYDDPNISPIPVGRFADIRALVTAQIRY